MLDDGILKQELWENVDVNRGMYPYGPKGPVPK